MTHTDLVKEIDIIKQRESESDHLSSLKFGLNQTATSGSFQEAVQYLMEAIKVYQDSEDYDLAIEYLNKSVKIFPTADAYYNKGVIEHCERNYEECFKAQTSAILLDQKNVPKAYFYRAHSLYYLCANFIKTNQSDEAKIFDFVIADLKKAASLGETNAAIMLPDIELHRRDLI
jgi:tetratricopeptide (TPR) repeat protein